MKKLYTFIALCVATLGFTTASAQDAPELSNDKCYTVSTPRSSWICTATGMNTTAKAGVEANAEDPNQQFAFLTIDGKTYLYSVGQKSFIANNKGFSLYADYPVYFKKGMDGLDGTFVVYFDNTHYINIGSQNDLFMDTWSTADEGNSCTFTVAGSFDPTEALANAVAPEPIKSLDELNINKLYTIVQKGRGTSLAVAEGKDTLCANTTIAGNPITGDPTDTKQQFAFITYNGLTYLYHAAEKKFLNKDKSLSVVPSEPIELTQNENDNTFVIKFNEKDWINVGGRHDIAIGGWTTVDAGNSCTITPVADFDPTEVLELLGQVTGIESATVTTKAEVYSLDGRKVQNPTKGIYFINRKNVYVK